MTNGSVQIPERDTDPAGQVLIDTLYLLSCKELKLAGSGGDLDPTAATTAAPTTDASGDTATTGEKETREKRLFDAALQKKTVVENLVPLLIQLNSHCEQKRSPISKYVRDCLRELIKDYKEEIMAIVHADSQLAQELLYDIQQDEIRQGKNVVVPPAEVPLETTPADARDVPVPSPRPDHVTAIVAVPSSVTESPDAEEIPPTTRGRAKRGAKQTRVKSPSPVPRRTGRRRAAAAENSVKEESDVEFHDSKSQSSVSSSSEEEKEPTKRPTRKKVSPANAPSPPTRPARKRKQ
jgi:hypothetical protein